MVFNGKPVGFILNTGNQPESFPCGINGNLHIIISVDAKDVLHYVARTLHVDAISRNHKVKTIGILTLDLHLEACGDALDGFHAQALAYEAVSIFVVESHREVGQRLRINILDLHRHFSASQFLAEDSGLL